MSQLLSSVFFFCYRLWCMRSLVLKASLWKLTAMFSAFVTVKKTLWPTEHSLTQRNWKLWVLWRSLGDCEYIFFYCTIIYPLYLHRIKLGAITAWPCNMSSYLLFQLGGLQPAWVWGTAAHPGGRRIPGLQRMGRLRAAPVTATNTGCEYGTLLSHCTNYSLWRSGLVLKQLLLFTQINSSHVENQWKVKLLKPNRDQHVPLKLTPF